MINLPKSIAQADGFEIFEHNQNWFFVNYGTYWAYTARFVLIVILIILFGNSLVQYSRAPSLGRTLLSISVVIALLLAGSFWAIRQGKKTKFKDMKHLARINFQQETFHDVKLDMTVPLKDVEVYKVNQLTSSSHALVAYHPAGEVVLARGNPFGKGIRYYEVVLKRKGLLKN